MSTRRFGILALALVAWITPFPAQAQGAFVVHLDTCYPTGNLTLQGPAGNFLVLDWATNPGDIGRMDPDGSAWVSVADGHADVAVLNPSFVPTAVGTATFSTNVSVIFVPDPCGFFFFDGSFAQVSVTAEMTDLATGQPFQLLVEAVLRNGQFLLLRVVQR